MKEYLNYCLKYQISFEAFGLLYMIANGMDEELREYVDRRGTYKLDLLEELYEKKLLQYQKEQGVIMFSTMKVYSSKFPFYTLDIDSWINDWFDLFPKGVKSGGYLVRSDIKSCKKKMQQFMKDYPMFDKDIIMKGTANYLAEMEQKGYSFMKLAPFFINKDGTSLLHGYCESLDIEPNDDPFVTKV